MQAANNKILVRVNMKQKDTIKIGDIEVSTALKFELNYAEKSPTVAVAEQDYDAIKKGDVLLCHHNTFYTPSPFYLQDDIFSIPCYGKIIFAVIKKDGNLIPLFGNIICEKVPVPSILPLPPEKLKYYTDRAIVNAGRGTIYKRGDLIFHRPNAGYPMIYNFNKQEKRVIKVPSEQICGIVAKNI